MFRGVELAIVLVAFLTVCTAAQGPFPRNRTLVYNYHAQVEAGTLPESYASRFDISGEFYVKQDTHDVNHPKAFAVALKNAKISIYNGQSTNESAKIYTPLPLAARILENPFLIVYKDGYMSGVKIPPNEPGWSRNMKQAMASMFQLDQRVMHLDSSEKPQKFASTEKTLYGDCLVDYKISNENTTDEYIIKKVSSLDKCSDLKPTVFDPVEYETCDCSRKEPLITKSQKIMKIGKIGDEMVIKSLVAEGDVREFLENSNLEYRIVHHKATFILENDNVNDFTVHTDFSEIPLPTDLIYHRPTSTYAPRSSVDISEGGSSFNMHGTVASAKAYFNEAVAFLEAHQLEPTSPDFNQNDLINKILYTMSLMDVDSLNKTYSHLDDTGHDLFHGILPHVGTHASAIFIKNMIVNDAYNEERTGPSSSWIQNAINMLSQLPMRIRDPSEDLLRELEVLILANSTVLGEWDVVGRYEEERLRSASKIAVATLVFRAFKNSPDNELLNRFIDIYKAHLVYSDSYAKKMTALQALGNLRLGRSRDILVSVIRGDLNFGEFFNERLTDLRLHAIWALEKTLPDYNTTHQLLWPITVDGALDLKLRLTAYDILIRKSSSLPEILPIHSFMLDHTNPHLQYYHYTTIKNIAEAQETCNVVLKQLAETLLKEHTKSRPPLLLSLSQSNLLGTINNSQGGRDRFTMSYIINPSNGSLQVLTFEHSTTHNSKKTVPLKVQLVLYGFTEDSSTKYIRAILGLPVSYNFFNDLFGAGLMQLWEKKHLTLDVIISTNGRVTHAKHYQGMELGFAFVELKSIFLTYNKVGNSVKVSYDDLQETHMMSEMGLPIMKWIQKPVVSSVVPSKEAGCSATMLKVWRHSDDAIGFYNPISGIWHSVGRSVATHIEQHLAYTINWLSETSIEMIIPVASCKDLGRGLISYSQDYTALCTDVRGALHSNCPTCPARAVITKPGSERKYHEIDYEINFTGFRLKRSVFDCDSDAPVNPFEENIFEASLNSRPKSWSELMISTFTTYYQFLRMPLSPPSLGSCGVLYKMTPSPSTPISQLKAIISVNADAPSLTDPRHSGILQLLPGLGASLNASWQVISTETNHVHRTWLSNATFTLQPGHQYNYGFLNLTRLDVDGKKYRACVKYNEPYNSTVNDILDIVGMFEKPPRSRPIFKKITWNSAEVNDDQCPSGTDNEFSVSISGYLSAQQKDQFRDDGGDNMCQRDALKVKMNGSLTPRTINCLNRVIESTTMRDWRLYVKAPRGSAFAASLPSYMKKLPLPTMDILEYDRSRGYFMGSWDVSKGNNEVSEFDFEHPWLYVVGNSRFPFQFLAPYVAGEIRICSIYTNTIATADGNIVPNELPSYWVSGFRDYPEKNVEVLVRNVSGMLETKFVENNFRYSQYDGPQSLLRSSNYMNTNFTEYGRKHVTFSSVDGCYTVITTHKLDGLSSGLCGSTRDGDND